MRAFRPHYGLLGLALIVSTGACKSAPRSRAPQARLDDIASIESELAANASRLEAQGLSIPDTATTTSAADAEGMASEASEDDRDAVGDGESPPESEPAAEAEEAPASPSDASAEREVRTRGKDARSSSTTRCERICDLAETTCELAERICALANEHVDDVRYAQACDRADVQCELASEACSDCAD